MERVEWNVESGVLRVENGESGVWTEWRVDSGVKNGKESGGVERGATRRGGEQKKSHPTDANAELPCLNPKTTQAPRF